MPSIQPGDRVCLIAPDGGRHLLEVTEGHVQIDDLGVVDMDRLAGHPWGEPLKIGQRRLTPVPATPLDVIASPERDAQIVTAKDAARIVLGAGIRPGDRVLEVGTGSGVLSVALADAVGAEGRLVSVDHRRKHQATAQANLDRAGLTDRVDLVEAKGEKLPVDGVFDAAVLDVPNPEEVVPRVWEVLRVGAGLAAYVPLVSQVEALRDRLREGWVDVRTLELIERPWVVHDRGARPEHRMLGHTGFLTFARRAAKP